MDSFQFQVSKLDKAYMKLKHKKRVIYKFVHFFRVIEICLISVFIWRNTSAVPQLLPTNVKFNKEHLHEFLLLLSSPRTVFLIGNAIILILFVESRVRQNISSNDVLKPDTDVYDEYIHMKDGVCDGDHQVNNYEKVKSYKRSKSETGQEDRKQEKAELRRSVTETKGRCKQLMIVEEEAKYGKGMSDNEFRDMVEAFIARQQRNLRQES